MYLFCYLLLLLATYYPLGTSDVEAFGVGDSRHWPHRPVWRGLRRLLNGSDDAHTSRGALLLERLLQRLPSFFDHVGVLERWNETCSLFNTFLPWLHMDCAAHRHTGRSVDGEPQETPEQLPRKLRARLEVVADNTTDVSFLVYSS